MDARDDTASEETQAPAKSRSSRALYDRRGLINATLVISGVLLAGFAIWKLSGVLLLILCAVMLAIVLDAAADAVAEPIGLPRWVGLSFAVTVIAAAVVAAIVFAGPTLADQLAGVLGQVEAGLDRLRSSVSGLDQLMPGGGDGGNGLEGMLPGPSGILSGATAALSSVLGTLGSVLVVVVVGIYLAAAPEDYANGLVRFAPRSQQDGVRRLVSSTGSVLRRWLIGKGISMLIVGVLSYLGLIVLGVPLALFLAVFAGLAAFVPFLGPVVGGIAMGLVALSESWQLTLWVLGLYLVVQTVESYLLTPIVQHRTVFLLPAVVLVAQLVMGTLFGLLGIALATPLTAIGMTVLNETYFRNRASGDAG
ncbi:AI-2E family transporter [Amorphus sp. 3PC139-8]|uniref:AI-2E family transporter n=1 Tax=Amorphus sp. 3PC139-8 TaxID=2735676 RepID=UPI00345DE35E